MYMGNIMNIEQRLNEMLSKHPYTSLRIVYKILAKELTADYIQLARDIYKLPIPKIVPKFTIMSSHLAGCCESTDLRYHRVNHDLLTTTIKYPDAIINHVRLCSALRDFVFKLDYNVEMMLHNGVKFLEEVIPHEVAHMVVIILNGNRLDDCHSEAWKNVMRALGAEPKTTHNFKNPIMDERAKRLCEEIFGKSC